MNSIQSKIEQTAKEYLAYKSVFEKDTETSKKDKEIILAEASKLSTEEATELYYQKFGTLTILERDMIMARLKLANQIELVKDGLDIPKEITDLVVDYHPKYIYAILGDEKKVVNKEAEAEIKEEFLKQFKAMQPPK